MHSSSAARRASNRDQNPANYRCASHLQADAASRAHTFVARHDLRTGLADQLSRAILRHWYQRCYLEAIDNHLGLLQPLRAVTQGEAREVAASIHTRRAQRIIGPDGVPLVTAHGTRTTDADRRLAAGETGVTPPPPPPAPPSPPNRTLTEQVVQAALRKARVRDVVIPCTSRPSKARRPSHKAATLDDTSDGAPDRHHRKRPDLAGTRSTRPQPDQDQRSRSLTCPA